METGIIRLIIYLVGAIGFAAINAAYLVWVERKGAGHIQRRPGPKEVGPFGLLQPLADGIKLMTKQLLVPDGIDSILFRIAPIMTMVPAIMIFVTLPFSETIQARNINLGLLMIFAFASINVMAILLAGWSSRNKYGIIAAARIVAQNVAYEIPMLITVITMVLVSSTLNLHDIVGRQAGGVWNWNILGFNRSLLLMPLSLIAFVIFFICSIAETNRAPFDMGEAESELVAGFHTEYSSMGFGLFFMAEYANIVIGACLTTILFLGGWHGPLGLTSSVLWFLLKIYVLICTVVWIRWTYPRIQFYGLLNLSWKVLIPFSLANLVLTAGFLKVIS